MKVQKVEFTAFNDGYAQIDSKKYRFAEKTVGMSRHYAAQTAGLRADRLIYVPYTKALKPDSKVYIGDEIYRIEQIQPTKATHPHSTILTLRRYGVKKDAD